ncbi:MAG TPA: alginate export family protein [Candidatus Omnitrophota bacterium]|nr:alginate export family protein [Candidatus Omnitrophota bacterium]
MRKVLLALAIVALIAMPAMASVQNVKVSGDIDATYVIRDNFDFAGNSQSVAISQTRLRVDSDLTDKVAATIGLINERAWGANTVSSSDIDLNLAYVTMKEMLYSPLTVTVGRQNFAFGNSLVIDSAGTNNSAPADSGLKGIAEDLTKQTAQDAVRLTFDYNPLTIDVLYSKIDQGSVDLEKFSDNTDLYGMNATYQFNDEKSSLVEGYFWVKNAKDKIYVPGVRGSMNVLDGWNLQAEVAAQLGEITLAQGKTDREAYVAQVLSNYSLPFEKTKKYEPVFGLAYTMYSGDKNPAGSGSGDDKYNAWDPMYENQAGGKIYNSLFNATNCQILGATLSLVPMEDVKAQLYYDNLSLMKEVAAFALVQPDGRSATPAQDMERDLGDEVGLVLTYDYTEDVQFGARAGVFFPGSNYSDGADENATQLIVNTKVAF